MGVIKLVLRRAGEMIDGGIAATTRTTEGAIVREAARVLRSRAVLFGGGVWFPPGVVIHLSPTEHERLSPLFASGRATVAAKVAARLKTPDGGAPEVRVVFDLDPDLVSGFAVSAFERSESSARLTLVKCPASASGDATNYPRLVWPDGRQARIASDGLELGREVVGPGRLSDPTVSARHAVASLNGEHLKLVDLGSTNGTWVNGARTSDNVLHHGDAVRIGATTLRVDWPAATPTALLADDAGSRPPQERSGRSQNVCVAWERLVAHVPASEDRLEWLSRATGVSFRALDRARRLQAAAIHGETILAADAEWAVQLLERAASRLAERPGEATA